MLRVSDGGPTAGSLPIVFVHGLGGSIDLWEAQLSHLRPSRRAVALDFPGHGQSTASDDYAIESFARDLEAVADKLELKRFVLAGHSLGGSVAGAFAAAHPERVAALLLVDATGDLRKAPPETIEALLKTLRGPELAEYSKQFVKAVCGRSEAVADRVLASMQAAQQTAVARWFEAATTWAPVETLRRYQGPKLLIHSELNDTAYSLVMLMPELPRKLIAAGHCLHLQEPAEFNAAMDAFLAQADALPTAGPAPATSPATP